MATAGLDAIFVTDPSNQAWLTGYDGWSFYVHQGVILTMQGEPIWWGRHMDMLGGRRTCWMQHENIVGYGDHFVQSTDVHPMQDLAIHLAALGLAQARDRCRNGELLLFRQGPCRPDPRPVRRHVC